MTSELQRPRIAVISMYTSPEKSAGLAALEQLAQAHGDCIGLYPVRVDGVLPDLRDFDVLLSSGGPGDPTELGTWGRPYAELITRLHHHNRDPSNRPKRAFLICHSFQIMSHHWRLGQLIRRNVALWGVHAQMPQTLPAAAMPVFPDEVFYALESRFYQVMPTHDIAAQCDASGILIAATDEAGALTAWQTADGHIAATQFHPEAQMTIVAQMLDTPPPGHTLPVHVCPPDMRAVTHTRLHFLPVMEKMLVDFITRGV